MTATFSEEEYADGTDSLAVSGDSTAVAHKTTETDTHKPEYYLQQIPRTPGDFAVSDSLWCDGLVALYYIYRDKVEDLSLADEALHMLRERFAGHPSLAAMA